MTWFLDPDAMRGEPTNPRPLWDTYIPGHNQAAAGLAGAAIALQLNPDATLQSRWLNRLEYLADRGQSPSGYFYDILSPDHGYNFNVGLPEMAEIYLLTRNPILRNMTARFTDWFGYVNLREPDGTGWLAYPASSSRTATTYMDDIAPDPYRAILGSHFIPEIPDLGAFFTSAEDMSAARAAWAAQPGPAPGHVKNDTSPRIISHAPYGESLPSERDKAAAIRNLPYLRDDQFVELRRDPNFGRDFLFVRRPSYYLGALFGPRDTNRVRSGPGFVWHPEAGTVVHSQRITNTTCWGTVRSNGIPDANGDLVADYLTGDHLWDGQRIDPGSAAFRVRYRTPDATPRDLVVVSELVMTRAGIVRRVRAAGPATEQVPLVLHPDDRISLADGTPAPYGSTTSGRASGFCIRRGRTIITFEWDERLPVTLTAESDRFLRDQRRQLHTLRIQHAGRFKIVMKFA